MNGRIAALTLLVAMPACVTRASLPAPRLPLIATPRAQHPAAPPAPSLQRAIDLPQVHTLTLGNGMRAYVVKQPVATDISVTYVARAGGENRDLKTLGLSTLAVRSVQKAREESLPAHESESLAAEKGLDMDVVRDAALLHASAHPDTLDAVLADLAATLLSLPLTHDAIASAVTEQLDALHDGLFNQAELGRLHAMKMLYGDRHPLGTATLGLHENLFRFKVNELEPHLRETLAPDTSALLISGDVDVSATTALVAQHFSALPAAHVVERRPPASAPTSRKARALLTPGRIAHIVEAYRAPPRDHADYVPFQLLSIALGELFTSRLTLALREQYEQTYSARSYYEARPEDGTLTIETEVVADAVGETLQHIDQALEQLRTAPLEAHELARAKLHARERIAIELESGEGTHQLVLRTLINAQSLPRDPRTALERELARIDAVTGADLTRVANIYLWPGMRGTTVSGPLGEYAAVLNDWSDGNYDTYVPARLKDRF